MFKDIGKNTKVKFFDKSLTFPTGTIVRNYKEKNYQYLNGFLKTAGIDYKVKLFEELERLHETISESDSSFNPNGLNNLIELLDIDMILSYLDETGKKPPIGTSKELTTQMLSDGFTVEQTYLHNDHQDLSVLVIQLEVLIPVCSWINMNEQKNENMSKDYSIYRFLKKLRTPAIDRLLVLINKIIRQSVPKKEQLLILCRKFTVPESELPYHVLASAVIQRVSQIDLTDINDPIPYLSNYISSKLTSKNTLGSSVTQISAFGSDGDTQSLMESVKVTGKFTPGKEEEVNNIIASGLDVLIYNSCFDVEIDSRVLEKCVEESEKFHLPEFSINREQVKLCMIIFKEVFTPEEVDLIVSAKNIVSLLAVGAAYCKTLRFHDLADFLLAGTTVNATTVMNITHNSKNKISKDKRDKLKQLFGYNRKTIGSDSDMAISIENYINTSVNNITKYTYKCDSNTFITPNLRDSMAGLIIQMEKQ